MEQFIEEKFRKVASREIQSAKRRFTEGERYLFEALPENNNNSEYDSQEFFNAAGENFAFATELGLKSNIKYDDFRRSPFFNQVSAKDLQLGNRIVVAPVVGTEEWHQALAGNIKPIDFITDPKEIRKNIILANNPNDERANIKTESQFNSQFLTLSKDGSRTSGHSLYAYSQLQGPVAKNLINTEYYCYVENEFKYTIYALLTEDILTNNNDGKTIMPSAMMEKLDAVKDAAVDLRYASISFDNVERSDLTFLKEFSSSVINVGEYRFPLPKQYAEIDFEQYKYDDFVTKGLPLFDSLDKMTKYYLQSCFNKNEISAFIKYIDLLNKNGISLIDLSVFINNAIYLKNFVKNKMQINLEFTEAQFGRIDNFCRMLKAFQPFDSNSKRLCDNDAFSTEEKINVYISKIKKSHEKNIFDIITDLQKQISIFIDMLNKGNNAILRTGNNKTLEGYPSINLSQFWITHQSIIKQKLFVDLKDNSEYDTARKLISLYEVTDPKKLIRQAGYTLYECKTEEDIQQFKKYWAPKEELCTFNGGRLNQCYVYFAVKDGAEKLNRDDFPNPNRQDEYGTSVISIQFTRDSSHTLSIKNRYNHAVSNPDATFSNNLDNIIPGLTESFANYYGMQICLSGDDTVDITKQNTLKK